MTARATERAGRPGVALPALVVALVALAAVVVARGRAPGLDTAVADVFTPVPRAGVVHAAATAVTLTAVDWVGVLSLVLLGVGVSVARRSPVPAVVTAVVALVLVLGVHVAKVLVAAAGPALARDPGPEPGFPSGHAATAVVVAGTAVVLLSGVMSIGQRRLAIAATVLYAAAVGTSRLYLGVHVMSDVVGGWLLGSVVVVATALVLSGLGAGSGRAGPPVG